MIGVDRIEEIRRRARGGEPIAPIARAVGVSEPTAWKYERMEDLSPEPSKRKEPESELLSLVRDNSSMTVKQMASELGVSTRQAERIVSSLKREGRLVRIGANRNGHWEVR